MYSPSRAWKRKIKSRDHHVILSELIPSLALASRTKSSKLEHHPKKHSIELILSPIMVYLIVNVIVTSMSTRRGD